MEQIVEKLASAQIDGADRNVERIIKNREMQLLASRNLLLPQLDASGLYRIRGFGKDLIDTPSDRVTGPFSSAWANPSMARSGARRSCETEYENASSSSLLSRRSRVRCSTRSSSSDA